MNNEQKGRQQNTMELEQEVNQRNNTQLIYTMSHRSRNHILFVSKSSYFIWVIHSILDAFKMTPAYVKIIFLLFWMKFGRWFFVWIYVRLLFMAVNIKKSVWNR